VTLNIARSTARDRQRALRSPGHSDVESAAAEDYDVDANVVDEKREVSLMMRTRAFQNLTFALFFLHSVMASTAGAQRQMESLGRGIVAIPTGDGKVFVGWRLLGTDPEDLAFDLYRSTGGAAPVKLNLEPIRNATNFVDGTGDLKQGLSYFVLPVRDGQGWKASEPVRLSPDAPARPYISIPLQTLPGHTPNDASVGDLDGDGEYEIVLKQEMTGRDNSQAGTTGETKLEAYNLGGRFLWRINLGKNIREGAHYTQFMVYDLDGDGKAEVVCKTADGTIDGTGTAIGDASADYRNASGFILEGPEFLTVFDGATGKALATTAYIPPRGRAADWGDNRGNRVDRFLAAVAYLDGTRPSVIMCRGYYTRTVLAAWNWRDGALSHIWTFDSDDGTPGNPLYRGQGNHNLRVGDVDGDGKDEIVYGACVIDDNGKGLYTTGLGHGDAIHLSDIDPDRPGLEVFDIHERPRHANGAEFRDARTGALIWGKPSPDVGRGVALDIDPRHRGYEMWASGQGLAGLWNVKGEQISDRKPRSCNFGVWWDGDLLREILNANRISKWNWQDGTETNLVTAENCSANNSTKSTPCLCADILGDWREEVIWKTTDGKELRIYTTTVPTEQRLYTLMHDPIYRLSVAYQNVGYNQPTQTGFYLGHGMVVPSRPAIVTTNSRHAR
jgi:rhamnogalacturonan endolyase